MIGDTNLFLHDSQGSCVAEIEIMIVDEASRGRRRGWESVILMLLYGKIWSCNNDNLNLTFLFIIFIHVLNRR